MFCIYNGAYSSVASKSAAYCLIDDGLLLLNIQGIKRTLVRRYVRRLMHIGGFCVVLGLQFDTALAQAPAASAPKHATHRPLSP